MDTGTATDEVTDNIALIEMHRQETQKEAGLAAACGQALRELHELLEREMEALRLHGPDPGRQANVDAVANEIQRVKKLAHAPNPAASSRQARRQQRHAPRPGGPRSPGRNKSRRTMGRRGHR